MPKQKRKKVREAKLDTLEQVKRLLILGLVHSGVKGKDIAATLSVDPATISRILPKKEKNVKKK